MGSFIHVEPNSCSNKDKQFSADLYRLIRNLERTIFWYVINCLYQFCLQNFLLILVAHWSFRNYPSSHPISTASNDMSIPNIHDQTCHNEENFQLEFNAPETRNKILEEHEMELERLIDNMKLSYLHMKSEPQQQTPDTEEEQLKL